MHGPKMSYGSELLRLENAVVKDLIELRMDTAVSGLLSEGGRVTVLETAEGPIEAGAVVPALNGFGGNREMVESIGPAAAALY